MTAKYQESRNINLEKDQLIERLEQAIKKSKFVVKSVDKSKGIILAKAKLNWLSWTENIRVEIKDDSEVEVTSICAFPLQIYDWGKNKDNVNKIYRNLQNNH